MNDDPLTIELKTAMLLLAVCFIGMGTVLGFMATPYVHGEPLLLTPENRAVKDYLDNYGKRIAGAEKEHTILSELLSPSRPGASAKSVFDLSTRARGAQSNLNHLARQIEQTRIPTGLAPLDDAMRSALAAELAFADKTLMYIGRADEGTRTDALAAGEDAKAKLANARQVLLDTNATR